MSEPTGPDRPTDGPSPEQIASIAAHVFPYAVSLHTGKATPETIVNEALRIARLIYAGAAHA